jgi:hypothetical protein
VIGGGFRWLRVGCVECRRRIIEPIDGSAITTRNEMAGDIERHLNRSFETELRRRGAAGDALEAVLNEVSDQFLLFRN